MYDRSLKRLAAPPTLAGRMRAWIKLIRPLAVAAALFCISKVANVQADALDVWHTRANFSASGIAYGNGKFVAVSGTLFQISPDGVVWTQYISPPVVYCEGIIFGGGMFMAYGYPISTNSAGPRYILQSFDGLAWTKVYETPSQIRGATYGDGRFVFVGDRIISTTLDPFQWTDFQFPALEGIAFGAGRFVAVSSGTIFSSADSIIWRVDYPPGNQTLRSVAYGNGLFIATWRTNYYVNPNFFAEYGFVTSSNLSSWQPVIVDSYCCSGSPSLAEITFGGGYFIGSVLNKTYTSTNGLDWINRVAANGANTFVFGLGTFVAAGSKIFQSDVFAPVSNPPPSLLTIANYAGVTIQGNPGQTYRIEYTTNLVTNATWFALTNVSLPGSNYLWVDTTTSSTVGRRFYRSILIE